jgi:hypothetical protein
MVCCSANPFYLQRHVCRRFFSIHPKSITSAERRAKFRLNIQSRYSGSILVLLSPSPLPSPLGKPRFSPAGWPRRSKPLRGAPATIAYAPNP